MLGRHTGRRERTVRAVTVHVVHQTLDVLRERWQVRVGREVREMPLVVGREAGQRGEEVRQEGGAEGGEVDERHAVQRGRDLVPRQRAPPALRQPQQQHRQELAQELRAEHHLMVELALGVERVERVDVELEQLDVGLQQRVAQRGQRRPQLVRPRQALRLRALRREEVAPAVDQDASQQSVGSAREVGRVDSGPRQYVSLQ